jgi:hypothetical protein
MQLWGQPQQQDSLGNIRHDARLKMFCHTFCKHEIVWLDGIRIRPLMWLFGHKRHPLLFLGHTSRSGRAIDKI